MVRTACVVSAEGGGGRFVGIELAVRMDARQRKHSPVPKKEGAGCGASVR